MLLTNLDKMSAESVRRAMKDALNRADSLLYRINQDLIERDFTKGVDIEKTFCQVEELDDLIQHIGGKLCETEPEVENAKSN